MTAHIVYTAIDETAPATLSRLVIDSVIRGEIGFDGVLVSDDLSMRALAGRDRRAGTSGRSTAGCDLVLHCNGDHGRNGGDRRRGAADFDRAAQTRVRAPRRCAGAGARDFDRARPSGASLSCWRAGNARAGAHERHGALAAMLCEASTWVLPVIFAVTFHEAAHGFVARRFGDDTAWRAGRVSFNPLKHIDPFGTVVLPALLFCDLAVSVRIRKAGAGQFRASEPPAARHGVGRAGRAGNQCAARDRLGAVVLWPRRDSVRAR